MNPFDLCRCLCSLVCFCFYLLFEPLAAWMDVQTRHRRGIGRSSSPSRTKSSKEKRELVIQSPLRGKNPYSLQESSCFSPFFCIELPEENEKGEVIFASYGRYRALFLGMTLLGLFCLGASLLSRYSVFPPASMVVFSQPNQTQMTHPAPLKGWIHKKFSLWNTEPIFADPIKFCSTFAQKQDSSCAPQQRKP